MKKWIMNWLLSDQVMRDYAFNACGWKEQLDQANRIINSLRAELNLKRSATEVAEKPKLSEQKKKRKYTKRKTTQE